jgi:ClpP class serine protease
MRYAPPTGGTVLVAPKAWGQEFDLFFVDDDAATPLYEECGAYAVVSICGPLTQAEGWWSDSYAGILRRAQAAFESQSEAVCLKINSPGGDFAGCFELARDLRALADASGKPCVAFTDGDALSAGYAIASVADSIVVTEGAMLGSVGVWSALIDVTSQDAMFGVKVAIAASGEHKADWHPHSPMTEESFARLQEQVKAQVQLFYRLVEEHRGIDAASLQALKGASLFGQAALSARLSDRIVTSWSSFISEEDSPMLIKSKASKYDEALGALKRAAEEDSEDGKKAKKALKLLEGGDEETDEEKKKKDDEKAKADADEEEKKKKDEEAKALAANNLAMAKEVQELKVQAAAEKAERAAEKEAEARAALFARRPDFSEAQRKTLAAVPLEMLKEAVDTWPRVTSTPGAAAAATMPVVAGGERSGGYQPRLSLEEQHLLDKTAAPSASSPKAATSRGNVLQMPRAVTPAQALARLKELEGEKEAV